MSAKNRRLLCAVSLGAMVVPFLGARASADDGAQTKKIRAELNKPTTFEFSEVPLKDVMQFLKKLHDINIEFDRKSLEDAGVNPDDTLITRQLKGVSLRSALNLVLEQLTLTYLIENELLLITTTDTVRSRAVPEVFDLGSWGLKPDDHEPLCKAVEMLLTPTAGGFTTGGPVPPAPKPFCIVRRKLIVRASEAERQRIANMLTRIKDGPDDRIEEKKADEKKAKPER